MSYQGLAPGQYPPSGFAPAESYPVPTVSLPQPYWTGFPQPVTCPHCQATMTSSVQYEAGTATWLTCLGICLLGGGLGCCLIPFCVDPLKDCVHFCSNCEQQLYRKNVI